MFALRGPLPVARFYDAALEALEDVGVSVTINPTPYGLGEGPAFPEDTQHREYDAQAAERWWTILRAADHVLARVAARCNGKASPSHLFWHSLDLAYARYSGRLADARDGVDA